MGGLIGTGTGYQKSALSGFARASQQEQQRETANRQLEDAQTAQEMQMGASAASMIAMIAMAWASDERLKDIIGPFTRGFEDVIGINPISFKYNDLSGLDTSQQHSGFSAQNLLETIPEAVSCDERGYYMVQILPIVAALVNAVKELKIEIEELKSKP